MSEPDPALAETLSERIANSLVQPSGALPFAPIMGADDRNRFSAEPTATMLLLSLSSHWGIFRRSLQLLRLWGHSTFPGVRCGDLALPSNPTNVRLMSSDDPISAYLRQRWQPQPTTFHPPSHGSPDHGGRPVEIEMEKAIETFSRGLARNVATLASGMPRLIRFTVDSNNSGYRAHRTEEYWFNPLVFGSRLSTPVDDVLGPGRYKFGGDKGENTTIIWDTG